MIEIEWRGKRLDELRRVRMVRIENSQVEGNDLKLNLKPCEAAKLGFFRWYWRRSLTLCHCNVLRRACSHGDSCFFFRRSRS